MFQCKYSVLAKEKESNTCLLSGLSDTRVSFGIGPFPESELDICTCIMFALGSAGEKQNLLTVM